MTAIEFLKYTYKDNEYITRPRVTYNDGFSISIQGGTKFHYCSPRILCNRYDEVELGFPSKRIPELSNYAEGKRHTKTVFGYVPIEEIEKVIEKHGGIKKIIEYVS